MDRVEEPQIFIGHMVIIAKHGSFRTTAKGDTLLGIEGDGAQRGRKYLKPSWSQVEDLSVIMYP